jgi:quercetin dioxygenase-like cupin family protein
MESFTVLGEPVEILISSEDAHGGSTTLTQTSPPVGGPPPHSHTNEDETFYVLEGDYEFLLNGDRHNVTAGHAIHAM